MDLARVTLETVFRAELGLDASTTLTERVLDAFSLATVEDVLHAVTRRDASTQPAMKAVPEILLDEADIGDGIACRLVREHGQALGDYAIVAARKVRIVDDVFPLVLSGGVLRHRTHLLADAITARLREEAPNVVPIRSGTDPVVGAVVIALQEINVDVSPVRLTTLIESARERRTMSENVTGIPAR